MHRIPGICLLIPLFLLLTGCSGNQTLKDSWKYTQRQYRTYLNTPASVDYEYKGDCEVYELALGEAVIMVDEQLFRLVKAMENSDRSPDEAWVMQMMQRFPWLSGVALVDGSGQLIARYPEYSQKEFDVAALVEPDPKQRMSALRAYVQLSPLGPEIYLANPVYMGAEMRGMVVAFFDPRTLLTMAPDPGNFMMASPAGVIWEGRFNAASTPVGQQNWDELLRRESCGMLGSGGQQFYWTTRYLGNLPLVYAMPADPGVAPASAVAPGEVLVRPQKDAANAEPQPDA